MAGFLWEGKVSVRHPPEKEKNNKISSNLKLRLKALGGIKGSQRVWSFEGVIGIMYSDNWQWHPLKGKKEYTEEGWEGM